MKNLVGDWFDKWERGRYMELPISDDFTHTSPFGTIVGKRAYLEIVKANEDKFLGHRFNLHDGIYGDEHACVRYTASQASGHSLDVSEWYYAKAGVIHTIVAYYHIGEIRHDRELDGL